ncbi:MAG TPA: adenylate kinase [Candidatus Caccousia avicola]|uniref:Adenylate kinase n=1 Tax=Candidatus Caccousia avicola TaxID=2840721 RepID=A0A9D1AN14_9FIRM|nr:adenylate kinase [Candidatus Caccousia avicola]
MILLLTGSTHTGKTALAQRLLERYGYPYLSLDLLKMGLIRSGQTTLTPEDDEELTEYLWPIVREQIKTAIENGQNLIVEGCYIPFGWERDFEESYLREIRYLCLVMTQRYLGEHFQDVKRYASVIEDRGDDEGYSKEYLIRDNEKRLALCREHGYPVLLIDNGYDVDWEL